MDIDIVGGGPGGAYAALLLKGARPEWNVTVHERNPPDETYGWGIVLPERSYPTLREADEPTWRALVDRQTSWDPIDTYYQGERVRCGGFPYTSLMRTDLLEVLYDRGRDLGVDFDFEANVEDPAALAEESDLLVGADGLYSDVRAAFSGTFEPTLVEGRNRFSWFGTEREFEALSHIYVDTPDGIWHVGAYPGPTSTFIVSCEPETFRAAGIAEKSEAEYLSYLEDVFADYLDGHALLSKTDKWRQFTTVSVDTWTGDGVALLGDAAHTAHFTIGSGTRMAMEDAIELADALTDPSLDAQAALDTYERERRPATEGLQKAAWRSRTFFEHVDRYANADPQQLAFLYLTRTGHNTYERVRERDASFVERIERRFAERETPGSEPRPPAEQPLTLADATFGNRLVVEAAADDPAERLAALPPDLPAPGLCLLEWDAQSGAPAPGTVEQLRTEFDLAVGLTLSVERGAETLDEQVATARDLGADVVEVAVGADDDGSFATLRAAVDVAREEWPSSRPLAARVTVGDDAFEGAIEAARDLGAAGCDLLAVDSTADDPVVRNRHAGWVRYGAGVPVRSTVPLEGLDAANTVLAGGKADLICLALAGE